jgi:hypothetical protein
VNAVAELQDKRLAKSQEILAQPGKGLADLTDVEFQAGIDRVKKTRERMELLIREVLVPGVDYDNPNGAFKQRILTKPGANSLRRVGNLTVRPTGTPDIIASEEWVCVTAEVAAMDAMGRVLGYGIGSCNTREYRFRKNGGGWVYADPREKVHDCLAMARKRATSSLILEVTGADQFFAKDDELQDAIDSDRPITKWTQTEKDTVYTAAQEKGIGKKTFAQLVIDTLGRAEVGTGDDVAQLLKAIHAWQAPKKVPAEKAGDDGRFAEEGDDDLPG